VILNKNSRIKGIKAPKLRKILQKLGDSVYIASYGNLSVMDKNLKHIGFIDMVDEKLLLVRKE
jgi:hypothetical protein